MRQEGGAILGEILRLLHFRSSSLALQVLLARGETVPVLSPSLSRCGGCRRVVADLADRVIAWQHYQAESTSEKNYAADSIGPPARSRLNARESIPSRATALATKRNKASKFDPANCNGSREIRVELDLILLQECKKGR
jgi:hypothetical protein